jgi:hypothetical protein
MSYHNEGKNARAAKIKLATHNGTSPTPTGKQLAKSREIPSGRRGKIAVGDHQKSKSHGLHGTSTNRPIAHVRALKTALMARDLVKQATILMTKRSSIKAQKAAFEAKYVGVDSKGVTATPYDDALALAESEIKTLRGMARESFGSEAIPLRLSVILTVLNTGTGLNVTTLTMDASNSPDFPSAALLFDEMKTTEVELTYFRSGQVGQTLAVPHVPYSVMAYDVEDLTALTSFQQGTAFSTHKTYMPAQYNSTATQAGFASLNSPERLKCRVPPGDLIVPPQDVNPTSPTFCVGTAWVPTLTSPGTVDPVGAVKFYEVNGNTSGTSVGGVLMQFNCHFRVRA